MYARSDISPERGARLDLAAPNLMKVQETHLTRSSAGNKFELASCARLSDSFDSPTTLATTTRAYRRAGGPVG